MAAFPHYLSIPEAAAKFGIDEARLRRLVNTSRIKAVQINGEVVVSEESVAKKAGKAASSNVQKTDLPEYKKFAHLAGVVIWLSEAARKYNIPHGNLSRWVRAGYISTITHDKNRRLLNEQDVAYCVDVYRANAGQGKWLFNKDGTPYKLKSEQPAPTQ